jgi:hypothetical protein
MEIVSKNLKPSDSHLAKKVSSLKCEQNFQLMRINEINKSSKEVGQLRESLFRTDNTKLYGKRGFKLSRF